MDNQSRLSVFRYKSELVLFFIVVIGLLIRLPNMTESFWYDELWSTHYKLANLKSLGITALADVHPPFYSIFMFLWINLFGDSEVAVRMPALVFGISSIILVYVLALRVADNRTALLAAFFLSVSPVHIWYSQEARAYSALLFFLLVSIVVYLKLDNDQAKPVWFVAYFVALFACVLTHYYLTAYLVLVSALALLTRHTHRRRILAMNCVILFCLFGWTLLKVVLSSMKTTQGDWRALTIPGIWRLFFDWFLLGNTWDAGKYRWEIIIVQLFVVIMLVRGLVLLFRHSDRTKHSWEIPLYLFVLPISLLMFAYAGFNNYIERSVFVALPFFFIAVAKGITGFQSKSIRYACIAIVFLVSAITVAAFFSRRDVWTVYKPNPDWRAAARYLESELGPLSTAPVFTITPADELMYYNPRFRKASPRDNSRRIATKESSGKGPGETWAVYPVGRDHKGLYERLAEGDARRFYLIHNRYWTGWFQSIFDELATDSRFQHHGMRSFKGLEVHAFDIVTPDSLAWRSSAE